MGTAALVLRTELLHTDDSNPKTSQPWLWPCTFFASLFFFLPASAYQQRRLNRPLSRTVHNNRRDPYQWKESMLTLEIRAIVCGHPSRRPSLLSACKSQSLEGLRIIEYFPSFAFPSISPFWR